MSLEKFQPELIYIGLDPWLFNENNKPISWKTLEKEYELSLQIINKNSDLLFFGEMDNEESINEKFYSGIIDKIYLLININDINKDVNPKINSKITRNIIRKDGRRIYSLDRDKITPGIIDYSMKNYKFSEDKFRIFENFIKYLKNNSKTRIVFVLAPYEFHSYKMTINKYSAYLEAEKQYKEIAKKYSLKIIGSYNLDNTMCENNEFLDHYHPNDDCMLKIIKN